jgi:hypothetical protein
MLINVSNGLTAKWFKMCSSDDFHRKLTLGLLERKVKFGFIQKSLPNLFRVLSVFTDVHSLQSRAFFFFRYIASSINTSSHAAYRPSNDSIHMHAITGANDACHQL